MLTVGVLALQGDFREHVRAIEAVGGHAIEVRTPAQVEQIDAVILPGGESTTMRRLLADYQLDVPLQRRLAAGMPAMGTCAGAILLAAVVEGEEPSPLAVMDVTVSRNAFGRQVDSFEAEVAVAGLGGEPMHAIFIRAPRIVQVGAGAEPLARLANGEVVAVGQGPYLATTFHPELTGDRRLHEYFLHLIRARDDASGAA